MSKAKTPKEAFFAAAAKPKTAKVKLGGQTVTIREMTVGQRLEFEAAAAGKPSGEVALLAVIASVIDQDGELLFEADDLPRLKELPPDDVLPIMRAVLKLNALTDQDVKDLAKN